MIGRKADRYIARRFSAIILSAIISFVVIFVCVDAFDNFRRWVGNDVTPLIFLKYYAYGLPYIIVLVLPIAVLLGSLFLVSSLARNNELLAMRAAGISIPRILLPMLLVGAMASIFELGIGDFIVADALHKQSIVERVEIEGREPIDYSMRNNFAYRSPDGIILDIDFFNEETGTMSNVTAEWFNTDSSGKYVEKRIDAAKLVWDNAAGYWMAIDAVERNFEGNGVVIYCSTDTLEIPELTAHPEFIATRQKPHEEMNIFELHSYIDRERSAGRDIRSALVELYLKFLFPLSNIIMVLVGAPLALRNSKSGKASSFGISILLAFIFFSLLRLGQSLGYKGILSPFIAASLAEAVFLAFGLFMLFRASRTT